MLSTISRSLVRSFSANMSTTYTGQTPSSNGTTVSPKVIKFYENFYAVSDSPSEEAHSQYVDSFTSDATLIMGSKSASGSEALMELRRGLWAGPVKTRRHTLEKIFPWDKNGNEVMLFGSVLYGLKNGKELTVDWAGRATLEGVLDDQDVVKMSFYQVYLDSAPVANATKD